MYVYVATFIDFDVPGSRSTMDFHRNSTTIGVYATKKGAICAIDEDRCLFDAENSPIYDGDEEDAEKGENYFLIQCFEIDG